MDKIVQCAWDRIIFMKDKHDAKDESAESGNLPTSSTFRKGVVQ